MTYEQFIKVLACVSLVLWVMWMSCVGLVLQSSSLASSIFYNLETTFAVVLGAVFVWEKTYPGRSLKLSGNTTLWRPRSPLHTKTCTLLVTIPTRFVQCQREDSDYLSLLSPWQKAFWETRFLRASRKKYPFLWWNMQVNILFENAEFGFWQET